MPRKARIDAPGALHHIIIRGIERRKIFLDDFDRDNFLKRLGHVLSETATPCFAWALIPNHAHLLLRTGTTAIATVMRRLLTGYSISITLFFNQLDDLDAGKISRQRQRKNSVFSIHQIDGLF